MEKVKQHKRWRRSRGDHGRWNGAAAEVKWEMEEIAKGMAREYEGEEGSVCGCMPKPYSNLIIAFETLMILCKTNFMQNNHSHRERLLNQHKLKAKN